MFKKLLSNLPYNPSLIGQVSFYAKRLHSEERVRRLGFMFVALAFVVQMFAFVSQPEPTLAESGNDILRGGFTTRGEAVQKCRDNHQDFAEILQYYELDCSIVSGASTVSLKSTAYNKQLDSLGRIPQGDSIYRPITGVTNPTDEYTVQIPGAGSLYMRNLWAWDSYSYSTHKALKMTNKSGQTVFLLYSCGNIVTIGKIQTNVTINKKLVRPSDATVQPDENVTYRLNVKNTGKYKAYDVRITDRLNPNLVPVAISDGGTKERKTDPRDGERKYYITWHIKSLDPGQSVSRTVTAKVGSSTTDNKICNRGDLRYRINSSEETVDKGSNLVCVDVDLPDEPIKRPDEPDRIIDMCPDIPGTQVSREECDVCPAIPGTQSNEAQCKPCEAAEADDDITACLILSKQAENETQDIKDADGTMANGGDVIIYSLTTTNTGAITIENHVVEENITDILDYATVTNLYGGIQDEGAVRWPAIDIKAGGSATNRIAVQVKNPIPSTPVSASDPARFDLIMSNVYGDTVQIELPADPIKTTETVTQTLPNTGPGENMAIAFAMTVFASYFFARTRLFAKELDIVREDFAVSGGY